MEATLAPCDRAYGVDYRPYAVRRPRRRMGPVGGPGGNSVLAPRLVPGVARRVRSRLTFARACSGDRICWRRRSRCVRRGAARRRSPTSTPPFCDRWEWTGRRSRPSTGARRASSANWSSSRSLIGSSGTMTWSRPRAGEACGHRSNRGTRRRSWRRLETSMHGARARSAGGVLRSSAFGERRFASTGPSLRSCSRPRISTRSSTNACRSRPAAGRESTSPPSSRSPRRRASTVGSRRRFTSVESCGCRRCGWTGGSPRSTCACCTVGGSTCSRPATRSRSASSLRVSCCSSP